MHLFADRASPSPDLQILHVPVDRSASAAGLTARIPPVRDHQLFSVPFRLVFQLSSDLSERCVRYFFRQPCLQQFLYIQVFHADDIVLLHQLMRHLVNGVLSLVPDLCMDLRDQDPLLLPVSAVLCLSGQFPLGSDQFLQVPVVCLRVLIFRSLARYRKRPDPEIDPGVLSGLRANPE